MKDCGVVQRLCLWTS